jgi:hypothetical protein
MTTTAIRSLILVGLALTMAAGSANGNDEIKGRWGRHSRNPVIYNSGRYATSHSYNPYSDHYHVNTHRTRVHASAMDPYRGYADPGSRVYVDRYVSNGSGGHVRERGWHWTSNGVRHQDTTRNHVYATSPWSSRNDTTRIIKDLQR